MQLGDFVFNLLTFVSMNKSYRVTSPSRVKQCVKASGKNDFTLGTFCLSKGEVLCNSQ
jgi:hypothetical protein